MSSKTKAKMQSQMVPVPRGLPVSSDMSMMKAKAGPPKKKSKMAVKKTSNMSDLNPVVLPEQQMMRKAPASMFVGKQNDALSTELYQMSNATQSHKYRVSKIKK